MSTMNNVEWNEWKRERAREAQRFRRKKRHRIDYQDVSEEAMRIIDSQRRPVAGGDASSILNRIVTEWAVLTGIK